MKWFSILLAIGLAASDKLDRTYLPPPGAQFAGGNLGDIDVPLELPHPSHTGPGVGQRGQESQINYGINGKPVNFGDKIPKVPTTTISYAFSQTTTYPPEGYETTAFPINPVTGLPVQLDQANYQYGPTQGQRDIQNLPSSTKILGAPNSGTNIQPDFTSQPTSGPAFNNPSYSQFGSQPLNQYPGQNYITSDGTVQIPGSVYQKPGQNQGSNKYPSGQSYVTEQQGSMPTGVPINQALNQYQGQNVISPGNIAQIPGGNQGFTQYSDGQANPEQQRFLPTTASPQGMLLNAQPVSNQYGLNYDGSQRQAPQGTYSGQPINVQNLGELQATQASYQNQEPLNVGGVQLQQYQSGNQNLVPIGSGGSDNVYQSGSTPTVPSSYYNGVSSTTPLPDIPSSTSTYSSVGPIYRPERPQAVADRNAVILNYENVRTPNGYSYSFDTSNGIHADENGIVDNGTKAQGSYSYTGDDGKVYSVIYTADENGFQPRGDHLPTPPPIPEAIKRVIEQAARDKAAGIFDDGSYDEAKYGDKKYQGTANRRRPQKGQIKPIVGLNDVEYDEGTLEDQYTNNLPITSTRRRPSGKLPLRQPSNQINDENKYRNVTGENRRVLETGEDNTPFGNVNDDDTPLAGVNNQFDFGIKQQESVAGLPMSGGDNEPFTGIEDTNLQSQFEPNNRGFIDLRPTSDGLKGLQNKYPGSKIVEYTGEFDDRKDQEIDIGNPNVTNGSGKNIVAKYDSVTGAPLVSKRKETSNQSSKGPNNSLIKKGHPQDQFFTQESTDTPLISDYIKNAVKQPNSNQYGTQQGESGYYYQPPKTEFKQDKFPTRFSPQEISSTMKPDQRRTGFEQGTTRRPFITPNVYYQNGGTRQSTTRRPFTTVGVTSPTDNSYTDYDDGDDYGSDDDIDDENTIDPAGKVGITSRPYQSTQTTSIPQYTPADQRKSVMQKGTETPGRGNEHSGTIFPGYTLGSTTPMPSHTSRFGSTEIPRREKPQQRRPSTTNSGTSMAVGRPVTAQTPSGSRPSDYNYQTIGPVSEYSGTSVIPGYTSNGAAPGFNSVASTPGSSTNRPSQGYSSTAVPPTSGYDLDSQDPSKSLGAFQPSSTERFHTGYHYGPPKSGYSTSTSPATDRSGNGFFSPGYYQQSDSGFPGTSPAPSTSGRPGTFILSQPGTSSPEFQTNYENGPSTPDYATTIVSSTPGPSPSSGYPGSSGTSRPAYSTTGSPSTVGTSPGSFVSSAAPGSPSQGYSTTYRPGFQSTQDTNVSGPLVDGFGRPIPSEQGGSYPGFIRPVQDSSFYQGSGVTGPSTVLPSGNRPVDNSSPGYGSTESSYPGSYDQTRVVGEDFSGPKQPQRFDPKTGYHYK